MACEVCGLAPHPGPKCAICAGEAVREWKANLTAHHTSAEKAANTKQRNVEKKAAAEKEAKASAKKKGYVFGGN